MNVKKVSFLVLFVFLGSCFVAAQSKGSNSSNVKKKSPLGQIRVGGSLTGGVSNNYYFLSAAPRVSMEVTKWFVPGVTAAYMYAQETANPYKATTNTYGAGVFTDFYPVQNVFGRIEYQHLWYNQKVTGGGEPQKYTFDDDFLLMGAGVKVPVGNKMSMFGSVLFNVLNNNEKSERYMFQNPFYSIGFEVGL
ncbi:MAG: hypothetical protein FWF09_02500 [Bacteroidales bacterium]|nr:hypothetical protein [Bacteroidales bacterium]